MRLGTGKSPNLYINDKVLQLKTPISNFLQTPNLAGNLTQKKNTSSVIDEPDFSDAINSAQGKYNATGTPNTVKNTLMAAKARDANFTPGKFWENA